MGALAATTTVALLDTFRLPTRPKDPLPGNLNPPSQRGATRGTAGHLTALRTALSMALPRAPRPAPRGRCGPALCQSWALAATPSPKVSQTNLTGRKIRPCQEHIHPHQRTKQLQEHQWVHHIWTIGPIKSCCERWRKTWGSRWKGS